MRSACKGEMPERRQDPISGEASSRNRDASALKQYSFFD
jgi:hypothetical protein